MHNTRTKGFTLIEMLIVVAIIAIIAAIAWPSYQNYVVRGRRVAAASCTMELSQYMERFYTQNLSYSTTKTGTASSTPSLECINTVSQFYTVSLGATTATTYIVRAVPKGVQATKDTQCGTLSIDQKGKRSITGSGTVNKCWQ